jgi:hypothetical protein
MRLTLHIKLASDATFGRGDGVAGLIDEEVEYDSETGLPFLRGRMLKGLLVEECTNILFALSQSNPAVVTRLENAAKFLFGQPGSTLDDDASMQVGAAILPQELSEAVSISIKRSILDPNELQMAPADVLESLTAIRRQTAVNEATGAPDEGSLRSMRVVLRNTTFSSQLDFVNNPQGDELALLTACVLSLRRGGTGRNRGRGHLQAWLNDETFTRAHFANFQQIVKEVTA